MLKLNVLKLFFSSLQHLLVFLAIIISSQSMAGISKPDNSYQDSASKIEFKISAETIKGIILAFKANPIHWGAGLWERVIFLYADNSDDVLVVIYSRILTGMSMQQPMHRKLFIAYVAGNLLAQLQNNVKRDHAFEGIVFMTDIYQKLRSKRKIKKIPNLDKLSAMRTKQLIEYVAHMEKHSKKVMPEF